MTTEDKVTYRQAQWLSEHGFVFTFEPKKFSCYSTCSKKLMLFDPTLIMTQELKYPAPTVFEAAVYLNDYFNCFINIIKLHDNCYTYEIRQYIFDNKKVDYKTHTYNHVSDNYYEIYKRAIDSVICLIENSKDDKHLQK